jgi:hypothetical protein
VTRITRGEQFRPSAAAHHSAASAASYGGQRTEDGIHRIIIYKYSPQMSASFGTSIEYPNAANFTARILECSVPVLGTRPLPLSLPQCALLRHICLGARPAARLSSINEIATLETLPS